MYQREIKYQMGDRKIITGRNEVVAKVMFLVVSVILFTGVVSASVHAGIPHLPPSRHPPGSRHPPWEQTLPGADTPRGDTPWEQTPPGADDPPGSRQPLLVANTPRHTVNELPVRILLECILFSIYICLTVRFCMLVDWFFLPYSLHLSTSQIALPSVELVKEIRTSNSVQFRLHYIGNITEMMILNKLKLEIVYLCVVRLTTFGSLLNQLRKVCFCNMK